MWCPLTPPPLIVFAHTTFTLLSNAASVFSRLCFSFLKIFFSKNPLRLALPPRFFVFACEKVGFSRRAPRAAGPPRRGPRLAHPLDARLRPLPRRRAHVRAAALARRDGLAEGKPRRGGRGRAVGLCRRRAHVPLRRLQRRWPGKVGGRLTAQPPRQRRRFSPPGACPWLGKQPSAVP
jgi:hypothetical protein